MKNILNSPDRKIIQERISKLTPQSKNLWGKMNVNQMLRHTGEALRMCMGEIEVKAAGNFLSHTLAKWIILSGFPAPKGKVKTINVLDMVTKGINPSDFKMEKKNISEITERFLSSNQVYEHAVFGKLTKKQLGRLTYIHYNHHLNQFGV